MSSNVHRLSVLPCLQRILPEQRLLDDEQQVQAVLAYLPNDASEWQVEACAAAAHCVVQLHMTWCQLECCCESQVDMQWTCSGLSKF